MLFEYLGYEWFEILLDKENKANYYIRKYQYCVYWVTQYLREPNLMINFCIIIILIYFFKGLDLLTEGI